MRRLALPVVILLGLVVRWLVREHTTPDTFNFLLPWYEFARQHGVSALGYGFTNYTPLYTYALLGVTRLDGLGAPLTLIKAISIPFELGCAAVIHQIVWELSGARRRAIGAFAACWLAPTVLMNGAFWGQAEAIWAFFTLLSVWLFLRGRNGVAAFGMGFATKFQAAFLGPFVLGMVLRRRPRYWLWLAVVPLVYIACAAPVLLAGRPLPEVLGVYVQQANAFHYLTKNAANIWVFLPLPYGVGTTVGLALTLAAGLALAVRVAHLKDPTPELLLKYACASLLLMPLLLPKMHERYFYGFELASIALAFVNLRYLPLAVASQVSGVLAYLVFESGAQTVLSLPAAAFLNLGVAGSLLADLWRRGEAVGRAPARHWGLFLGAAVALIVSVAFLPAQSWLIVVLAGLTCVGFMDLVRDSLWGERAAPSAAS